MVAEIERLETENKRLRARNAEMREALTRLTTDIKMTPAALDSLSLAALVKTEDENAHFE